MGGAIVAKEHRRGRRVQRYESVRTLSFGKDVVLPDPVGITLPAEPLKDWVR
ncbi:hypothetical protein ABIC27_003896 [Streptomyces sp. PvR034]